jgi:hypothetical protein
MATNSPVRVWVRSLGNSCRVRVDSVEDARWILDRLKAENALTGLEQLKIESTNSGFQFQIPNATRRTLATLENALGRISGVELMLSPEDSHESV